MVIWTASGNYRTRLRTPKKVTSANGKQESGMASVNISTQATILSTLVSSRMACGMAMVECSMIMNSRMRETSNSASGTASVRL